MFSEDEERTESQTDERTAELDKGMPIEKLTQLRSIRKNDPTRILQWALAYAELGWKVFPLCPGMKIPFKGSHGFKDGTTDAAKIKEWWTEHPKANIGVACVASGFIVIDADTKKDKDGADGVDNVMELEAESGFLPKGPKAITARDGSHSLFKAPRLASDQSLNIKLGNFDNVDVKGHGFIVVEPSELKSKAREDEDESEAGEDDDLADDRFPERAPIYRWETGLSPFDIDIPELDDRLRALIVEKKPVKTIAGRERKQFGRELESSIEKIRTALRCLDPDDFNVYASWFSTMCSLHHFGASNDCLEEMFELFIEWSATLPSWDEEECRDKWDCIEQNHDNPRTIGSLFHDAKKYGFKVRAAAGEETASTRLIIYACSDDLAQELEGRDLPASIFSFSSITQELTSPAWRPALLRTFERKRDAGVAKDVRKLAKNADIKVDKNIVEGDAEAIAAKVTQIMKVDINAASSAQNKPTGGAESDTRSAAILLFCVEKYQRMGELEFFLTPPGEVFATFENETWPLMSRETRAYLRKLFMKETEGCLVGNDAMKVVSDHVAGLTRNTRDAMVRVAHSDGNVYVDLANGGKVVEISNGSWQIIDANQCPVKFFHPRGLKPLPLPESGQSLEPLRQFMNLAGDGNFERVVLFLASSFSLGPQMILNIQGQQGSAKSFAAKVIKMLLDPNEADLMTPPDKEEGLFLACRNQHVVVIDNESKISPKRSDAMCRIATGGASRTRELYSNGDEFLYKFRRPQIVTSIRDVVTRSDLAERTLKVKLEPILEENRKTEKQILAHLENELAGLLGALFSLVAGALEELPKLTDVRLPRMADAAEFMLAVERHMKWPAGTVSNIFDAEIAEYVNDKLDCDPFISKLIGLVERNAHWTVSEDRDLIGTWIATGKEIAGKKSEWDNSMLGLSYPSTAKEFSNKLETEGPTLRQLGLKYQKKTGGTHAYVFTYRNSEWGKCPSSIVPGIWATICRGDL